MRRFSRRPPALLGAAAALCELLSGGLADIRGGSARLGDEPGLGVAVDAARLRALCRPG